nr:MAG TPA: major capsid protein [Bacteriophage sp.]
MSYTITQAQIKKFDPEVKGIYQANSRLGSIFHTNNAHGASTYQVTRLGYGIGSISVPGADIPNMNSATLPSTITLENWNHAEYIDYFQAGEVNWDAIGKSATEVCAPAAGRRNDQIILDVLAQLPNTYDIAWNYQGNTQGISARMVQRANTILSWNAVPMEDRYFIAPYSVLEVMLSDANFTSRDYVRDLTPALSGEMVQFGGFKWVFMANNPEGGMPYVDNGDGSYTYECFACHKRAVEVAVGEGNFAGSGMPMLRIDRVPEKGSWMVNAPLSCGAAIVENKGIVRVHAKIEAIVA